LFNLPALMARVSARQSACVRADGSLRRRAQTSLDELAFESFGFRSLVVAPAALCASLDPKAASQPGSASAVRARAALVLDLGFSATHCVPVFDARVQWSGCRRINLGGKALTNHLKELVSYRTMNMMDEFYLMDRVKERLCYVGASRLTHHSGPCHRYLSNNSFIVCELTPPAAQDLEAELSSARLPRTLNPVVREYVLPDGVSVLRGFVRGEADDPKRTARAAAAARAPRVAADANEEDEEAAAGGVAAGEQVLTIGPERFMVPEALLHPSGVGSPQAGLAEACVSAVNACGADIRGLLWSNVVLVGGGAACPGMRERLTAELRPLVPDTFSLNVSVPAQPERAAWRGASVLARSDAFQQHQLARADYLAQGGAKRDAAVHHGTTARPPPGRIW